ncbi:MAG TPA: sugar nucleotide-binding protein [Verrucomicrobiae bacterium]|nr:sugar nucleotide-binding protein [Verrucomicrobiae bacterium]
MTLLLGASGYIGRTFASELRRRGHCFIPLTRRAFDYTRFDYLFDYIRTMRPVFLINAASYEAMPGASLAEGARERMMAANAILPQMIARVCLMTKMPWGHVSSGSVYCGAKVVEDGKPTPRRLLGEPETLELFDAQPEKFHGFTEIDEPNSSFRNPSCNFYSGTKALAEEAIKDVGQSYIWRLRRPFNEREEMCNWLWQMQRQAEVTDGINSYSHLEDSVRACLDLWALRAPFGIYNVTNPGAMTTGQVAREMRRILRTPVQVRTGGDESAQPSCILDSSKLLRAGVKLRPIEEALEDCLDRLRASTRGIRSFDGAPKISSASVV